MAAFTALGIGLLIAGTATKVVGAVRAGRAAKRAGLAAQEAAESQAQLSDYNAAVAELQAKDAEARGRDEEGRFRQRVDGMIGTQRAGIAAGNIDVNFGSAVDVQADAAFLGELDALQIRTNAAREAWGYKVEAEDARQRAVITRKEGVQAAAAGREAQVAARFGAVGSIIEGASAVESRYGFGRGTKSAAA